MRKSLTAQAVLAAAVALLAGSALAPALAEEACVVCHRSPEFKVKNRKLYDYNLAFERSIHGIIGLGCSDCHGGDPDTTDLALAHEGVMAPVRFDNIPKTCGACHEGQYASFVQSEHYRQLMDDGSAPNCVTCHGAMDMDFYFTNLVRTTCTFCHNPSEGIAPDVPQRAEYILSKINVIKGYRAFVRKFQDDEDALTDIEESYQRLTESWHLFDLHRVEVETEYLLGLLRKEKAKAIRARREHGTRSEE